MISLNERMMDMGGEVFSIERNGEEKLSAKGLRSREEREVKFYPGTDVQPGDWLITRAGKRLYVHDTDVFYVNQDPFAQQAFYRTEAEHEAAQRPSEPSQSFVFHGPAQGIFGSQQDFSFEQVIGDLDRQIEEKGGEDKEELHRMLEEIRETLQSQDSISRSKFEGWSEMANKHAPWLLGPLGSLLINYAFGIPTGG